MTWQHRCAVVALLGMLSGRALCDQPRVETPSGTFLGGTHTSKRQGRTIYTFTGIPFAKPPVDGLRFSYPLPYGEHKEIFNATKEPPPCLHWDNLRGRGVVGKEDCLYLNVFTNRVPPPPDYYNTQPTIAFLHAGTWMAGSGGDGLFQPDYLLESDVCVITVNHRLGPFGFLSTEDPEGPGNYGLMDQIMALEWIHENGRYFGCMNDSVTVMGSGAGGISANLLMLSPKTRGAAYHPDDHALLHKAISHSGTAYSPHAISKDAKVQALKLSKIVGCPTATSKELMSCLRMTSPDKIVEAVPSLYLWDDEPLPFAPVVDKWQGPNAVIPDEPHHLIKHREFLQVPWLVGTNKDDGAFRVQDILKDSALTSQLNTQWDKYGPILLDLDETSCKDPVEVSKKIRQYYMGKKKFGYESSKSFVEMMTDRFFLYPTDHAAKDYAMYLKSYQTYRYELVYSGRKSFLDLLHQENPHEAVASMIGSSVSNPRFQNSRDSHGWGVSFLDELLFLFPSSKLDFVYKQDFKADSASQVSTHMLMLWTNFVKGSDPTPVLNGWPDDLSPWGAWWEPFVNGYLYYLRIDPEMESLDVPLKEENMQFWEGLPLFENRDQNVIRDEL
ncbi:esterase-6-like [Macrobrachium rosenbergii]|uniref:esterase-6-like n=1 Tax=Macrobrachium rosenbergii TaxID=79674 RepID=UPI0034D6603D